MAKILQLVLFTISNLLIFGILLALIIKYYYGFSEFKYIWFCSKILTVKKMITKNNNQDIVFSHYYNGDTYAFTKLHYLDYLERIDKNGCLENYKKCGILDTYGNSICFPQSTECPINDMIFELQQNYPNTKIIIMIIIIQILTIYIYILKEVLKINQ